MINYKITAAPASEPVTLTEVKDHLKVTTSAEDDLLNIMIQAAREEAEKYCSMGFVTQTVTEYFNRFPSSEPHNERAELFLSVSPLSAVSAITYTDSDGNEDQTLSTSNYVAYTYASPPRIGLANGQTWPSTLGQAQTVKVVYTVGYGDETAVPAAIKMALLLTIGHWYDNRADSVRKMPTQAEYLLDRYKVYNS